jgi:hypothetical protein
MAPRIDADRLDPFGLEVGEVLNRHRAAVRRRVLRQRLSDLAAVERGAARLGDRAQASRPRRRRRSARPTSGGRPFGRNASAQPGSRSSSGAAATHFSWTTIGTA